MDQTRRLYFAAGGGSGSSGRRVRRMAGRDGERGERGGAPPALSNFSAFSATLCWSAVSLVILVADSVTDVALVAYYWHKNYFYWSLETFLIFFIPTIIIQLFSMRWHIVDEAATFWHWISHICLSGLIHRHTKFIKTGYELEKSKSQQDLHKIILQQSDICMLHLFESFLEAAPQLILQLYITTILQDWKVFIGLSIFTSLCSLSWAIVNYLRVLRRVRPGIRVHNLALFLQITWRGALLIARISALLLFAVGFQYWIFLLIGLHWTMMTIWVIYQKTDFCPSRPEEVFYNCVIGVIYCFCFFNLKEGQARYRMFVFYIIMISQNIACLFLFIFLSESETLKHELVFITVALVIGGTLIGVSSMLIFYRWFHPAGPIKWIESKKETNTLNLTSQIENNQREIPKPKPETSNEPKNCNMRSLKKPWMDNMNSSNKIENSPQSETECTDKKLLLDHWIARAGSPTFASAPVDKNDLDTTGVEFYSVVNTPEKFNKSNVDKSGIANTSFQIENEPNSSSVNENIRDKKTKIYLKNKRSGICSPIEVRVSSPNVGKDKKSSSKASLSVIDMSSQKRRAICSSSQLQEDFDNDHSKGENLTDNFKSVSETSSKDHMSSNEKTSSGSVNFDLDLSFSDINSSDINEFNENIVQKLCLSTLKNIKNVHQDADIQNIQRIALEILKDLYNKGGLKEDQDIESELSSCVGRDLDTPSEVLSTHDYENICAVNIAREAWGLRSWRACADMGASPPPPPLPARRHPPLSHEQNHYINTIAYELSKCEESNCEHREQSVPMKNPDNSVFIAKPYVIDQNGGMFPLATPLEPILEEIDLEDINSSIIKQQRRCSESALVATIDEIRHDTVTNSPRNVYHRADWDSPHLNVIKNKSYRGDRIHLSNQNMCKELWKESTNEYSPKSSAKQKSLRSNHNVPFSYKDTIPITTSSYLPNSSLNKDIAKDVIETYKQLKNNEEIKKYDKNKKSVRSINVHNSNKENLKMSKIKSISPERNQNLPGREHNLSYEEIMFLSQLVNENNSLLAKKRNSYSSTEDVSNLCISSSLQLLIDQDTQNVGLKTLDGRSSCKKNGTKPRRKFSLLREKFEPKSKHSDEEMLFQSLESIKSSSQNLGISTSQQLNMSNSNIMLDSQESKIINDKENMSTFEKLDAETCPISVNNETVVLSLTPCDLSNPNVNVANLKEKRSLFLKQVLSPPKISNLSKKS